MAVIIINIITAKKRGGNCLHCLNIATPLERGKDIKGAVAFRMKEVIPSGPGEVSWGRAVIKVQIVEGEQRRSLGKRFELLGGERGRGGVSSEKI